ncbi:MAG: hypothetical protein FWD55_09210, partial [Propionibacteriaceae bacterium]|nr:hypothetical protein [Propionibacteriaceae bacterium]
GFLLKQSSQVMDVVLAHAAQIGAHVDVVDPECPSTRDWEDDDELPLYQCGNWALALAAVSYLGDRDGFALPDEARMSDVRRVVPPARFEWINLREHRIILDGAHSPLKMRSLVETLQARGLGPLPTLATLSTAPETKIVETIEALAPIVSHLIVPEFRLGPGGFARVSVPASQIAALGATYGLPTQVIPNLDEAVRVLLADPSRDLLVTGSLYIAALVRPLLS